MRPGLHLRRVGREAALHQATHGVDQQLPLGLDQGPVREDGLEFGRAEVFAVRLHERQRVQPVGHARLVALGKLVLQQAQMVAQFAGPRDLAVQCAHLLLDDQARRRRALAQHRGDVAERQAELPQRLDAMQPRDVPVAVQPPAGLRAARGLEQADLVVVVQGAHRQARALGELPDLQHHGRSPAAIAMRCRSRRASSVAPACSARTACTPSQARTGRRQPCADAVSEAACSTCGLARPALWEAEPAGREALAMLVLALCAAAVRLALGAVPGGGPSLAGGALLVLVMWNQIDDAHSAEEYACLLTILAGTSLVAAAHDLAVLPREPE